jgi:hypothetical protein
MQSHTVLMVNNSFVIFCSQDKTKLIFFKVVSCKSEKQKYVPNNTEINFNLIFYQCKCLYLTH